MSDDTRRRAEQRANGEIDRRSFITDSARAGAGLVLGAGLLAGEARAAGEETATKAEAPAEAAPAEATALATPPDLSIVTGPDAFKSTLLALEQLGGIKRYVSAGDRVGLLINAWKTNPGTYTRPELVLAMAQLCFDAGAKQVVTLKDQDESFFELMPGYEKHAKLIAKIKPADSGYRVLQVKGKVLRQAEMMEQALDFERLFNLPIVKDHSGCQMTGCLKNMMGISHFRTNLAFHLGPNPVTTFVSNIGEMFPDITHFAYCIADLYTVRKPDLCVMDATEFITTNGPGGPGKLARPNQVMAGADPVIIDALCSKHLGLEPGKVDMIKRAHELGVGQIDPVKLKIKRAELG